MFSLNGLSCIITALIITSDRIVGFVEQKKSFRIQLIMREKK